MTAFDARPDDRETVHPPSLLARLLALIPRRRPAPAQDAPPPISHTSVAWELAGYGRGADATKIIITNLQSMR